MTRKKMGTIGAALCGLAGLTAMAFGASTASANEFCDHVNWTTGSQCFDYMPGFGYVGASAKGITNGIGVSLDLGPAGNSRAIAYTYDDGDYIIGCTAVDDTVNGDSSYDLTGCSGADTYRIYVRWWN